MLISRHDAGASRSATTPRAGRRSPPSIERRTIPRERHRERESVAHRGRPICICTRRLLRPLQRIGTRRVAAGTNRCESVTANGRGRGAAGRRAGVRAGGRRAAHDDDGRRAARGREPHDALPPLRRRHVADAGADDARVHARSSARSRRRSPALPSARERLVDGCRRRRRPAHPPPAVPAHRRRRPGAAAAVHDDAPRRLPARGRRRRWRRASPTASPTARSRAGDPAGAARTIELALRGFAFQALAAGRRARSATRSWRSCGGCSTRYLAPVAARAREARR